MISQSITRGGGGAGGGGVDFVSLEIIPNQISLKVLHPQNNRTKWLLGNCKKRLSND